MVQDALKDKFDKCKEGKICPNDGKECIIKKENNVATPLIFENTFEDFVKEKNKYKIVLITESPYNFPGCPIHKDKSKCENEKCKYWAKDVDEFTSNHLQKYGLERYKNWEDIVDNIIKKIIKIEDTLRIPLHLYMPYDIFDFIFYTFFPIFKKENNKENWGETFTKKIYWTHVAKRSLKGLKNDKKKEKEKEAVNQCIPLLKEELEVIQPNLIIVATRHFWEKFGEYGYESYKDAEKEQEIQFNDDNSNFLLINMLTELFQQSSPCPSVVVFPNPSPLPENYENKVNFYKKRYVPKLIEKIHEEIYNKLPDC